MIMKAFFCFPELYVQIRFFQTFSVVAYAEQSKEQFPDTITGFEQCLETLRRIGKDRMLTFLS
jgi:hypothetical protein